MNRPVISTLREPRGYTRSKTGWILGEYKSIYGKLIHYLSGGGMRAFGRTVRQEEARVRQTGFAVVAAVLAGVWLVFYIF